MSEKSLVARIGQIATKGKHKERFLFVGTIEPKSTLDRFFYLIEIDSPWVDGEKIRNAIVGTLAGDWSSQGNGAEIFENIIKKINAELGSLSESGEHEWVGKLNAIIGLISKDELIFSQTGRISGYLFRGNKISHITEKPVEEDDVHPLKTFVSIIDGNVAAGDKVAIANSVLYSHISLDRLRQVLSTYSYTDAIDEIAKNLRKTKIKDANLIVFDISDESDEKIPEENQKPEIIILDDIPDSPALHYTKTIFKGLGSGAKATGRGAKKLAEFWSKSVSPKIAERIKSGGEKPKKNSSEQLKPATGRFDRVPKVNYFHKKTPKGSSLWANTSHFLQNLWFWIKSFIKPENRKYLYIVIIVLLLAIGFIKIQLNNKKHQNLASTNSNIESLDTARSLFSKATTDLGFKKPEGKDELIAARDAAVKAAATPAIADEANNLLAQINAKLDEINNAERISAKTQPTFSLPGNLTSIQIVGASLYTILNNGTVSKYDTRSKTLENFGQVSGDFGKVIDTSFSDNDNSLVILTDKPAVVKLDLSSKKTSELKTVDGSSWEKSVAISTYVTNIYLLDRESGQVWKHSKSGDSYTKGSAYVSKQPVSIKGASDLSIDGNIYVAGAGGSVIKVVKGVEDASFKLSGIPTPTDKIAEIQGLTAGADINSMYVFDKTANRLLQFSKSGAYQRQFVMDGMAMTNFAVNEKLKKLWLIAESKVYELDI